MIKGMVSVIIPVYNVYDYLNECLDSVINQTYKNLEIIIIDDGSTDGSGEICDYYAMQNTSIQLIHQTNGGSANAKNAGLRLTKGEYLAFVDSDDVLELDYFEKNVATLVQSGASMVHCGYFKLYTNRAEKYPVKDAGTIITGEEFLLRFLTDWTCSIFWNKLFRRKLFKGIYFEEGHVIDDEYFTYRGTIRAKNVALSNNCGYRYRLRKSSAMRSRNSKRRLLLDRTDYLLRRYHVISVKKPQLRSAFLLHLVVYYILLARDEDADKEVTKAVCKGFSKLFFQIMICPMELILKWHVFKMVVLRGRFAANEQKDIENENWWP